MVESTKAVVLVSGGLDSATTLAMARHAGFECHALAVDYGQRHRSELQAAQRVADAMDVRLKIISLDLRAVGGSALTDDIEVPEGESEGIPVTYVPARNTIMLSLALGLAEVLEANSIFIGVNAVDYSGYPDCRPGFIRAFQAMAKLATKAAVVAFVIPAVSVKPGSNQRESPTQRDMRNEVMRFIEGCRSDF